MSDDCEHTTEQKNWTDELPVSGRAADSLDDEYDSVDELMDAYRQATNLTDFAHIGQETARDLREFIHDRDPDAERARNENDEGVCTEFTTDHGLDKPDSDVFCFAFICPRCDAKNPLKGDPSNFKNKPFHCEDCSWVSLLEANALNKFADSVEVDA